MGHVADMSKAVQRDEAAQAVGMMGWDDPILEADDDLGRRLRGHEKAANVDRLAAARENGLGEAPLFRDQRPLPAQAQGGLRERRAQRRGIASPAC